MNENNMPVLTEQEKKRRNLLAVAIIICSIAVIVLVILKFAKVISVDAYFPVIALTLFLQSCMLWKTQRKIAVFQLCVGVFSILVFLFTTYIHFLVK